MPAGATVTARDEAAEILLEAWKGFIPKGKAAKAGWVKDLWEKLEAGFGEDNPGWKADFLCPSENPAVQLRRLATAIASLPLRSRSRYSSCFTGACNQRLLRNKQMLKELQKLAKRDDADSVTRARMISQEYARNQQELELLERGIADAETSGIHTAEQKVVWVTQRRLGDTDTNKQWKQAEKQLGRKQRAELTRRALAGGPPP